MIFKTILVDPYYPRCEPFNAKTQCREVEDAVDLGMPVSLDVCLAQCTAYTKQKWGCCEWQLERERFSSKK